ncbi:hypothetical protein [Burkholderia savannae]|uniref:hypothetical protein n=1 Tax=Burkholderia savannae TaxID=1637837 RepID=UPI000A5A4FA7|nr:hypothetical protein [Burkholderia savannae]
MKFDPNSPIRSQRENMQAFQLRLPKEVIRDLQILRVFAGVKVSEELRDLVCAYVESKRDVIQRAAKAAAGTDTELKDDEQKEAAGHLVDSGDAQAIVEARVVKTVRVDVDAQGNRVVTTAPTADEDKKVRTYLRK